jgi:DnaJ-class molecular chaperone
MWNERQEDNPQTESVICRQCNGTGKTRFSPRSITEITARCSSCNGTGEIQTEGNKNG